MTEFLEILINSPKLPFYLSEIQDILEKERQKRADFYNLITENDKAEFINGEIIFQSPVKWQHNKALTNLNRLLDAYVFKNNLGYIGIEKVMISLKRNDYEPDLCFFSNEKAKLFEPEQMLFPAPDFVVEILSPKSKKNDRGVKFEDYAANGIPEYWIVDPTKKTIEQYILRSGEYYLLFKGHEGKVVCHQIQGFEITVEAIFNDKLNMLAFCDITKTK